MEYQETSWKAKKCLMQYREVLWNTKMIYGTTRRRWKIEYQVALIEYQGAL